VAHIAPVFGHWSYGSEGLLVPCGATKIAPARPASVASARHDWERTALVFVGIALATVAGLAAWARS